MRTSVRFNHLLIIQIPGKVYEWLQSETIDIRGAFFVGGAVGQQSVSAKVTQSAQGQNGAANFSTSAIFVEPQIGFLYRTSFGLAIGCDLGLEIPVTAHGQSSVTDGVPLPGALSQAMTYAEKGPIPSVNLLRLGYVL